MTASSTALPTTGDTDAATAYSIRTVQYATVLGYRPLELDVHTVTGAARTRGLAGAAGAPVIVWIHGGGWEAGSRSDHPPVLDGFYRRFADAGYVVVSIDYRLSREVSFPACLHDCKAAIRWVRANATDLGADPARIGVWGESAGGHLAALIGLTGDVAELEGDVGILGPSSAVAACVPWYPPADFEHWLPPELVDADSVPGRLFGGAALDVPEVVHAASPIVWVTASAPPVFVQHGDADQTVPVAQGRALVAALRAAGASDVTYDEIAGYDHCFDGYPQPAVILDRVLAFFDRTIGHPAR
jgi:acetyl esterase/lipase